MSPRREHAKSKDTTPQNPRPRKIQNTGLTWGNLSSHLSRLETAGYVEITKEFVERKPHTMVKLTPEGRTAFDAYRRQMKALFDDLPDE